jgi:hypothetical protein
MIKILSAIMDDDGDIRVYGASSKEEARECAMNLHKEECPDYPGITLSQGRNCVCGYDEPEPAEWEDYYFFRAIDADHLSREYFEY